ncbi:MAG: type II toxin-antitoxin system HicA family toxin [Defluviitaleaceae bacterium]|nr:type II toxin-antitoxin system HicA family toxin [Defluviitaleaceae bacterium]
MKISEFTRQLKAHGIKLVEHGAEHDKYISPSNGKTARVPRHQSKEIKTGTREKILKDLGIK